MWLYGAERDSLFIEYVAYAELSDDLQRELQNYVVQHMFRDKAHQYYICSWSLLTTICNRNYIL